MIIAVAYDNGEIGEHFGHAKMFALYEYTDMFTFQSTKRLIDSSNLEGHKAMADLLKDNKADAVIVGRMGPEAKSLLLSYGIVPVVGYCGDADTAADMLISGELPLAGEEGGCGGGCGGCGGCHHEEGEDGECGCGCGCGE